MLRKSLVYVYNMSQIYQILNWKIFPVSDQISKEIKAGITNS